MRDLVGAGAQHRADILGGAHAAADRQRDEDRVGGAAAPRRASMLAALGRGRDVVEDQLVGALAVVQLGQLDRVASVAKLART